MAITTSPKPKAHQKKRLAQHHRHSKHYLKAYWPYLPLLVIVSVGFWVNSLLNTGQVLGASTGLSVAGLLGDTNQQRQAEHESDLTANQKLNAAAQAKANDMVSRDYWSHNTPDGKTPWTFITAAGYTYQSAGENLAYGFDSSAAVLDGWMHSPEHKANVLGNQYQNVGFGIAKSTDFNGSGPETVIVALYGSPQRATSNAQPEVLADATSEQLTRVQLVSSNSSNIAVIIGVIGSLSLVIFLIRHSLAWRHALVKGENFVLRHPLFDIALIILATVGLLLEHSAGFIH